MPQVIRNSKDLKQCLINYNRERGYDISDSGLKETLFYDLEQVYEKLESSHRWWTTTFKVAKLPFKYSDAGYLLIGFCGATTTGDMSPEEIGWEFDWNLFEVESRAVTEIVYVKRNENNT